MRLFGVSRLSKSIKAKRDFLINYKQGSKWITKTENAKITPPFLHVFRLCMIEVVSNSNSGAFLALFFTLDYSSPICHGCLKRRIMQGIQGR